MNNYMLDFTNDNLDEGKPIQAVKEGEYVLRLIDWKSDEDGKIRILDKNDLPYIMPVLEIVDCPEADVAKNVTVYMPLPHPERKTKNNSQAKYDLGQFFKAFGIDYGSSKIDPESMVGMKASAILIIQEDSGYGESNKVKKWVVGH